MDIKKVYEAIDFEIGLEKERPIKDKKWAEDYTEGFMDGLHRAKEVIDELYPPIPVSGEYVCEYEGDCSEFATHYNDKDQKVCHQHI